MIIIQKIIDLMIFQCTWITIRSLGYWSNQRPRAFLSLMLSRTPIIGKTIDIFLFCFFVLLGYVNWSQTSDESSNLAHKILNIFPWSESRNRRLRSIFSSLHNSYLIDSSWKHFCILWLPLKSKIIINLEFYLIILSKYIIITASIAR